MITADAAVTANITVDAVIIDDTDVASIVMKHS